MKRELRLIGIVLFVLGVLVGVSFNGLAVWADVEAFLFEMPFSDHQPLRSLSCPVLMTGQEQAQISAKISNPIDRTTNRVARFYVTHGALTLIREEETRFDLAPRESRQVRWNIEPGESIWGRFVLARVFVHRATPLPARSAACGIVVVNIGGLSGATLTWLISAVIAGGLVLGSWLWLGDRSRQRGQPAQRNLMMWLTGLLLLGLFANLLGLWMVAGFLFLVTAVTLLVTAGQYSRGF
ncbi:MAG: hypothetical protein R3191_01340 [Anaerolineales bacterium]|nr:hypothetical protein [Anaerolineales bacterium]